MKYLLPLLFCAALSADVVILDKANEQFIVLYAGSRLGTVMARTCRSLPAEEIGKARECRTSHETTLSSFIVGREVRQVLNIPNTASLTDVTKKIAQLDFALKKERFVNDAKERQELADAEKLQKGLVELERIIEAVDDPEEELELSTENSAAAKQLALFISSYETSPVTPVSQTKPKSPTSQKPELTDYVKPEDKALKEYWMKFLIPTGEGRGRISTVPAN